MKILVTSYNVSAGFAGVLVNYITILPSSNIFNSRLLKYAHREPAHTEVDHILFFFFSFSAILIANFEDNRRLPPLKQKQYADCRTDSYLLCFIQSYTVIMQMLNVKVLL